MVERTSTPNNISAQFPILRKQILGALGMREQLRHSGQIGDSSYPWQGQILGRLEALRQGGVEQNKTGWGTEHKVFHERLRDGLNIAPKRIAAVGVGVDATLVKNLQEVYPDAEIYLIELNDKTLEKASETLKDSFTQEQFDKLRFLPGNAVEVLEDLSSQGIQFDLVDVQLLFVHLSQVEMTGMIKAIAENLTEEGILTVNEATLGSKEIPGMWEVIPSQKFKDDPEAQALAGRATEFMQGDDDGFPGASRLVWYGPHIWKGPDHLSETIECYGDGQLKKISHPAAEMAASECVFEGGTREALLASCVAATLTLAYDLKANAQAGSQGLTTEALKNIERLYEICYILVDNLLVQDNGKLSVRLPQMVRQAFGVKKA